MKTENAPGRYLIAIGSPSCPEMGLPELDRVSSDVERITGVLCDGRQGYRRVLADRIPLRSPARTIEDELETWFASPERAAVDCVIVYIAGHGGDEGKFGDHYLFTSDSNENRLNGKAIRCKALAQLFFEGAGERPQNVLLLLDTCYSAQGAGQAAAAVAGARSKALRPGAGFWVISSADANTEAADGAFVDAVCAVLTDEAWLHASRETYLNPASFKDAINEYLDKHPQRAEMDVVGSQLRAEFIRNPGAYRHRDGQPLEDEGHWDPKARGVEGIGSAGWFFTGRKSALVELSRWLIAPVSRGSAVVVTGQPGSGKSALLGRLVVSAHHSGRADMIAAGVLNIADGTAPPEGSIRAAVHARGLSTERIAEAIARQIESSELTVDGLLRHLARQTGPLGLVIDAIDEAVDPNDLESQLLRKLADCAAVRLVVGSRRRRKEPPLAGVAKIIDLDSEVYFDRSDLEGYIFRRLVASAPQSPYSVPARKVDAQQVAAYVAKQAGFSFLYARLVARSLAAASAAIDTSTEGWIASVQIPEDLPQAFEEDLRRFPPLEQCRLLDLLVPLAYARGKGLPQKSLWAAVASGISKREYTNFDIREVKATAGYYIVQDTDSDEVVYRLFHQEFADYLKELTRDEDVERSFAAALKREAAVGWDQLREPYIQQHLAAHAATAGTLDDLIGDPAFLLHAAPEVVLPHLSCLKLAASRRIAAAYRRVSHHMRAPEIGERASYLRLAALQDGLDKFAESLGEANPWKIQWAAWGKAVPGEVVLETEEPISALAISEIGRDEVAVSLGVNGAIQVWLLPRRERVGCSAKYDGTIEYLAIVEAEGSYWLVGIWQHPSAHERRGKALTIRVLEYPSCRLHAEALDTHLAEAWLGTFRAAATRSLGGQGVLAVAASDDSISLWTVPCLQERGRVPTGHGFNLMCMVIATGTAGPLLIASFDACRDRVYCDEGILTRAWTLPSLSHVADHYFDSRGTPQSMTVFDLAAEEFVVIQHDPSDGFEILDMPLFTRYKQSSGAFDTCGTVRQDSDVLLCGALYGKFCYAAVSRDKTGNLVCGVQHTHAEIRGTEITAPVNVHGRLVLATVDDATRVRLWDIGEMVDSSEVEARSTASEGRMFRPGPDTLTALAVDAASSTLFVGDRMGKIVGLDTATGSVRWESFFGGDIVAAAIAEVDGRRVVVFALQQGELRMFDVVSGAPVGPGMNAGHSISAIATHEMENATLCFVATQVVPNRPDNRILVLDLQTGQEVHILAPTSWGIQISDDGRLGIYGYSDKSVEALCVARVGGQPVLLGAGPYSFVGAWTLPPTEPMVTLEMDEAVGNTYVYSVAAGTLRGRTIVAAGNRLGLLCVWDLATHELLHRIEGAHASWISAIAVVDWFDVGAVLTGGSGHLRLWSPQLELLQTVDFESPVVGISPLQEGELIVATHKGLVRMTFAPPQSKRPK